MKKLDTVFDYIDIHFDEHLKRVQEYLSQPSISHTGEGIMEGAELTMSYLEELGAEDCRLWPEEPEELCSPVVYGVLKSKKRGAKTLFLHCMYDMMPITMPELWVVPPFESRIIEGTEIGLAMKHGKVLVARGAKNQKGPLMAALNGIKAMLEVTGDVPVNVIFAIEGEEERSSFPTLREFRDAYVDELQKADAMFYPSMSDDELGRTVIYLGSKGLVHMLFEVKGGDWGGPIRRDLSSTQAGWVDSPTWRLVQGLSTLEDSRGVVTVEGFYEDVKPPTEEEKELLEIASESIDEEALKEYLGVAMFRWGLSAKEMFEEYMMRPTFNINALEAGYAGPSYRVAGEEFYSTYTKIPHIARARLASRIVPDMKPDKVLKQIRQHLDNNGFSMVNVKLMRPPTRPWRLSSKEPIALSAIEAVKKIGRVPLVYPNNTASSGMHLFTKAPPLGIPGIIGGPGYGGRQHSQNEFITVEGIRENEKWTAALIYSFANI